MLGNSLLPKTTVLLVFFLQLVVFEKFVNNRIVDHLEKCGIFLISTVVLGLLDELADLSIVGLLITWRNVSFFLISTMVLGLLHQLQIF